MKLTDSAQLDWGAAHAAALKIVRTCEEAQFTAPEALDLHRAKIIKVCDQLHEISKALCITETPTPTPKDN